MSSIHRPAEMHDRGSAGPNEKALLIGFGLGSGALALAADLWEVDGRSVVEPATILTIALVLGTLYYAFQNRQMAASMRAQVDQAASANIARQRESHILDVQPLLAGQPKYDIGKRVAIWDINARGRPVLHLTASLRAMAAEPDAGSIDGRSAEMGGLGSLPPDGHVSATITLDQFLRPRIDRQPPRAYEEVWEAQLTVLGIQGLSGFMPAKGPLSPVDETGMGPLDCSIEGASQTVCGQVGMSGTQRLLGVAQPQAHVLDIDDLSDRARNAAGHAPSRNMLGELSCRIDCLLDLGRMDRRGCVHGIDPRPVHPVEIIE